MSVGISLFMSFKFNVHVSLLIQTAMLPVNAYDSVILKKYLIGATTAYNELTAPPTAALVEELNRKAGATATAATSTAVPAAAVRPGSAIPDDEPRVVELDGDDDKLKVKETTGPVKRKSTAAAAVPSSSSSSKKGAASDANEID
jgi:hypothetical protein